VVVVIVLTSLQCVDSIRWMTGRSSKLQKPASVTAKGTLLGTQPNVL